MPASRKKGKIVLLNGEQVRLIEAEHAIIKTAHRKFEHIRYDDLKENTAVKRFEFLFEELDALTAQIEGLCLRGIERPHIRARIKKLHERAVPIEEEINEMVSMLASHHGELRESTSELIREILAIAERVNPWLDAIRRKIEDFENGKFEVGSDDGKIRMDIFGEPVRKGSNVPRV